MPAGMGFLLIESMTDLLEGGSRPGIENYYGRVNIPVMDGSASRTFPIPYRKPAPSVRSGFSAAGRTGHGGKL